MTMRLKLMMTMAAVALFLTLAVFFLASYFPYRMSAESQHWAQDRAGGMAALMAASLAPGLDAGDAVYLNQTLGRLDSVPDAQFAVVVDERGAPIASWQADRAAAQLQRGLPKTHFSVEEDRILVSEPISSRIARQGRLLLAFNQIQLHAETARYRRLGASVALLVGGGGIILAILIAMALARPIAKLAHMTAEVVRTGDLTRTIELMRNDELGSLARSVAELVAGQRAILARLHKLIGNITGVVRRVSEAATQVSSGGHKIQRRVEDTARAANDMLGALGALAQDVDALEHNAENSSASLIEMTASNKEVASNVQNMASSAKLTSTAVERMASSISEIAQSIDQLNSTISETSLSTQRMDTAITEVERNTKETARLGERVSSNAEIGVEALQKTLEGIANIKNSSNAAAAVISNLGARISEIGAILRVIDEVAAQTKLLSLNAAIIAAQAGEHGRGFSVVADQIKELAQRTGASTREITSLIAGIQEESRNAMNAMNNGAVNVEAGVRLGNEAADALERIRYSANEATAMIRKIAQFTMDQSRGSKQMTQAIERIAQSVAHISSFSTEQARGAEQIIATNKSMDLLTEQVRRSSDEQSQGSRQVIAAIESINMMVSRLTGTQRDQRGGAEVVQRNVEEIRKIAVSQAGSTQELEQAIASLSAEAQALEAEMGKYKV